MAKRKEAPEAVEAIAKRLKLTVEDIFSCMNPSDYTNYVFECFKKKSIEHFEAAVFKNEMPVAEIYWDSVFSCLHYWECYCCDETEGTQRKWDCCTDSIETHKLKIQFFIALLQLQKKYSFDLPEKAKEIYLAAAMIARDLQPGVEDKLRNELEEIILCFENFGLTPWEFLLAVSNLYANCYQEQKTRNGIVAKWVNGESTSPEESCRDGIFQNLMNNQPGHLLQVLDKKTIWKIFPEKPPEKSDYGARQIHFLRKAYAKLPAAWRVMYKTRVLRALKNECKAYDYVYDYVHVHEACNCCKKSIKFSETNDMVVKTACYKYYHNRCYLKMISENQKCCEKCVPHEFKYVKCI
jgi:hypothetical protein